VALSCGHAAQAADPDTGKIPPLRVRISISETLVGEVNEGDAAAALKVWSEAITRFTSIALEGDGSLRDFRPCSRACTKPRQGGKA
jgi:hypothetical protein